MAGSRPTWHMTRIPLSMQGCMQSQNEIGWNLTMCGLFDDNGSAHQDRFFASKQNRRINETGLVWSIKLTSWMLREARAVWLSRNHEALEPDNGNSKEEQEILEQVRNLYKSCDDISHLDRAILDVPITERLQRPIPVLTQWIQNTAPIITGCICDFQQLQSLLDVVHYTTLLNHSFVHAQWKKYKRTV